MFFCCDNATVCHGGGGIDQYGVCCKPGMIACGTDSMSPYCCPSGGSCGPPGSGACLKPKPTNSTNE
jgi:hypothetical protein